MASARQKRKWSGSSVISATGGVWVNRPTSAWIAEGVKTYAPSVRVGDLCIIKEPGGNYGINVAAAKSLNGISGLITTENTTDDVRKVFDETCPILEVQDTDLALENMARYLRDEMSGIAIGITGSSGKTTVTAMFEKALSTQGSTFSTSFNGNTPRGVAWNLASSGWDTSYRVIEMSIKDMRKSSQIVRPHIAIFLNVHPAHLGRKHNIDDIARAKSEIFSGMDGGQIAIINRDMHGYELALRRARLQNLKIITFGESPDSDVRLSAYAPETRSAKIKAFGKNVEINLTAEGRHMAINTASVVAGLIGMNVPLEPCLKEIEAFTEVTGRGNRIKICLNGRQVVIIDESYNANPGSVTAAIEKMSNLSGAARRVLILGEMKELGSASEDYHTSLAKVINEARIDRVFVVGDLFNGFWAALSPKKKGDYFQSVEGLKKEFPLHELHEGDHILIKGSNSARTSEVCEWLKRIADSPI